jgi:hypothetical protein
VYAGVSSAVVPSAAGSIGGTSGATTGASALTPADGAESTYPSSRPTAGAVRGTCGVSTSVADGSAGA